MPTCSVLGDVSTPRRGWHLWRFAALIPSGCRLPPIHKVMGDHASRAATPAGASPLHGLSGLFFSNCSFPMSVSDIFSQVSFPKTISNDISICPFWIVYSRLSFFRCPFRDVHSRGTSLAERQSGCGHGRICNLLIIRYHNGEGVETWPKKGCVSTPCFINH